MRIGLISDTHDKLPTIDLALEFFHMQCVDLVMHCGDWKSLSTVEYFNHKAAGYSVPVIGVLGNNDTAVGDIITYAQTAPGDFELHVGVYEMKLPGNKRLAAYHGHHKPTLRNLLTDDTYSIILLGHSHKPKIDRDTDKLVVNPGSTAFAIPRQKSWKPSVAIINTARPDAVIHYLT